MLLAVSNDDDHMREIYTGAEFNGIDEEEEDGHESAAEEHYQRQALPSRGCINSEHISLHLSSHMGRS